MLVAGALAVPAAAQSPSTLADQILADADGQYDRNWYDFDVIGEIVKAILAPGSGVTSQLGAAAGPVEGGITAFLPNDRAFQVLAWDLTGRWYRSEADLIPAILGVVDLQTVNTIVEYHVVPGVTIDSATALQSDNAVLTTLMGATFKVDVISKRWAIVQLVDNDRNDLNPFLVKSKLDNVASNGIWHGISLVLRPIDVGIKWER
jgi:hypothetical protein